MCSRPDSGFDLYRHTNVQLGFPTLSYTIWRRDLVHASAENYQKVMESSSVPAGRSSATKYAKQRATQLARGD
jgi:hypothetical protein